MKNSRRIIALICAVLIAVSCVTIVSAAASEQHKNYINGFSDGLFHPNDPITRAEIAQMIYNIKGNLKSGAKVFADVDSGSWYAPAVNALAAAGIMKGYTDGTFKPNKNVTKAEVIQIVTMMSGKKTTGLKNSFSDVPASHWAYHSVALAEASGWIKNTNGTFKPDTSMTRAETVNVLNNFLGRSADKTTLKNDPTYRYFPDVNPSDWFYYDVMEASISHTATRNGSAEVWIDATRYQTCLRDGFAIVQGSIRLIKNGYFVAKEGTGTFGGVSYRSTANGVITVPDGALKLCDNSTVLIINGKAVSADGLYDTPNGLFCIQNGKLLIDKYYNTLYFGKDGKYTSGNKDIDSFIDNILASITWVGMTQEQKLRACYDYIYNHVDYRSNNNHVPRGAAPSEWTEEYMLRLINTGKGNCYCYASEMYYFARRIGYYSANAVSGGVTPDNLDHGWCTVTVNGQVLMLDPELDTSSGPYPGSVFLVTYKNAPFHYWTK